MVECCLTSAERSFNSSKNCPTVSHTLAFLPRQRLAVTSSRVQSPFASSALKSGLYTGKRIRRRFRFGVRRKARIASPRWAGALSQMISKGSA